MASETVINEYKKYAKALLQSHKAGNERAVELVTRHVRDRQHVSLMTVQFSLVREAGFHNWNDMLRAGDAVALAALEKLPSGGS